MVRERIAHFRQIDPPGPPLSGQTSDHPNDPDQQTRSDASIPIWNKRLLDRGPRLIFNKRPSVARCPFRKLHPALDSHVEAESSHRKRIVKAQR
jgi:hypothetical protein